MCRQLTLDMKIKVILCLKGVDFQIPSSISLAIFSWPCFLAHPAALSPAKSGGARGFV
jgi:hypothetical protein